VHYNPEVTTTARRFLISGRVQGVGYRYFALREARALDLRGWVRNIADGSMEAYAAGEPPLDTFKSRLLQGPGSRFPLGWDYPS
jgi:acylphosphatase